jgi:hypothetical protein
LHCRSQPAAGSQGSEPQCICLSSFRISSFILAKNSTYAAPYFRGRLPPDKQIITRLQWRFSGISSWCGSARLLVFSCRLSSRMILFLNPLQTEMCDNSLCNPPLPAAKEKVSYGSVLNKNFAPTQVTSERKSTPNRFKEDQTYQPQATT